MSKVGENRKCTEWPQTELEQLTVKSTLYTLLTPEGQIMVRFALRLAVSEIQGRQKSKNALSDPKLNLNIQQSKVPYT